MKKLILACTRMKRPALLLAAFVFSGHSAWAVDLSLSTNPMDVQQGVDPNIIFTMDDSGSMAWSYLPDGIRNNRNDDRGKSSTFNLIYFDPTVTYQPGVDENGLSLGDASFTAAWDNGFQQGATCTINLATSFRPTWRYGDGCDGSTGGEEYAGPAEPAYYFQYNAACGNVNSDACYTKSVVSAGQQQNFANWYSYYRKRHMLAKSASTLAFSQVSSKVRLAYQCLNNSSGTYKCNTVSLMQEFSGTARTNFFTWLRNVPFSGGTPLLRAVENAGNEYSKPPSDNTNPYRQVPGGNAAGDGVEYACRQSFHIAFTDGVWNTYQPGIGNVDNKTITLPGFNAASGDKGTDFGINSYTPMPPFKDSNSNYLADIAMLYWASDLRPDLDNIVPQYIPEQGADNPTTFWNPANDPAHWQHMVNFTVSMGLAGDLDPQTDKAAIFAGTKSWGNNHVDDLWHAAINGRGQYFTAENPESLVDRFTKVLNAISERKGSSTAPATSFPLFAAGSFIFQPRFSSSDWSGELIAIDVTQLSNGINFAADVDAGKIWSAAEKLNALDPTKRHIMSYDPDLTPATDRGIKFDWASMKSNGTLQTLLNRDRNGAADTLGADRVDYIGGVRTNEQPTGNFRARTTTVLGDLVNSTPVFVGSPFGDFRDSLEAGEAYSKFKDDKCDRPRVIYVGGNDGMLHGFDAGTFNCTTLTATMDSSNGDEIMAYVPSPVYRNLSQLPDPIYKSQHRFFVDGSPTVADVFYGGKWHTMLAAGLNAGGQGIYALDVTTGIFDKNKPNDTVMWEFTDLDDKDLGYTFSQPRMIRLSTGSWAVTFGNGYNNTEDDSAVGGQFSSSGNAVLYVLNAETGALVKKLDTGVGLSDAASNGRPNGLSTAEPIDFDDDSITDFIYAGDLYGNMWKFDVRSSNTNQWKVEKLFVASTKSGATTTYQPITAPPKVIPHPTGTGGLVLFGTGKHLEVSDLSDVSLQSMYGVWDRFETSTTVVPRNTLFEQRIIGTESNQFIKTEARVTSKDEFDYYTGSGLPSAGSKSYLGWYMDLFDPLDAQPYKGEKMVKNMVVRGQRIIFVTDVPSEDPCEAGGASWLNELDARNGSRLPESPFDFDFDGQFTVEDLVDSNFNGEGQDVVGSSIRHKAPGGKFSAPTIIRDLQAGPGREKKLTSNSDGSLSMMDEADNDEELGRRSWRQLLAP